MIRQYACILHTVSFAIHVFKSELSFHPHTSSVFSWIHYSTLRAVCQVYSLKQRKKASPPLRRRCRTYDLLITMLWKNDCEYKIPPDLAASPLL